MQVGLYLAVKLMLDYTIQSTTKIVVLQIRVFPDSVAGSHPDMY